MLVQYPQAKGLNQEKGKIYASVEYCHTASNWWNFAVIHAHRQFNYRGMTMQDDERCCGTGTCIIDTNGHCWCGQQWDGEKMCHPALDAPPSALCAPDLAKPADSSGPAQLP